MSRNIVLNLAMSIDGFIADTQGGYEWIAGAGNPALDTENIFDFGLFLDTIDIIVMGRKAYEDSPEISFENQRIIVASSGDYKDYDNVEFYNGNICTYVQELQEEPGNDIWLYGGGQMIDCFIKNDLVDEYIIAIVPMLLGTGRPLFLENNPCVPLQLEDIVVEEGLTILHYSRRESI
jgi:dihydrofolate reductase